MIAAPCLLGYQFNLNTIQGNGFSRTCFYAISAFCMTASSISLPSQISAAVKMQSMQRQRQARPCRVTDVPSRMGIFPRINVVTQASQSSQASLAQRPTMLMNMVEALFKFPPLFSLASNKAREMIVKRAETMGINWNAEMEVLKKQDWESRISEVTNPSIVYPSYYTQPFHAYTQGNLCWEAALEVTMAAKSVHAFVMDPNGKQMDVEGDHKLRTSYSARMQELMQQQGVDPGSIRKIVDMGCATGLSSLELLRAFPGASVTGVDLSPHFLAVAKYEQQQRQAASGGQPEALMVMHAAAEATGLPDGSQDLVSICLVCHELPQAATQAIFKEAARILRPGGCLAVMEMNPASPAFQRIFNNAFAFAAFKSTEPWLQEYITLDMPAAMREAGFQQPLWKESTPRHKTVVAVKPQ